MVTGYRATPAINVSSTRVHSQCWDRQGSHDNLWLAIIYFITGAAIFAGNMVTLVATLNFPLLRTMSNLYIVSLAATDALVGLLEVTVGCFYLEDLYVVINGSEAVCVGTFAMACFCLTCSMLHMCIIALDRYCYIAEPFEYEQMFTKGRIYLSIVCIWTFALLFGASIVVVQRYRERRCCQVDIVPATYRIYVVGGVYVACCAILVYYYARISVMAWRTDRETQRQREQVQATFRSIEARHDQRCLSLWQNQDPANRDGVPNHRQSSSTPHDDFPHHKRSRSESTFAPRRSGSGSWLSVPPRLSNESKQDYDPSRRSSGAVSKRSRKRKRKSSGSSRSSSNTVKNSFDTFQQFLEAKTGGLMRKMRSVKLFVHACCIFLACSLPLFLLHLLETSQVVEVDDQVYKGLVFLLFLHSGLNVFIYPCYSRYFWTAIKITMSCRPRSPASFNTQCNLDSVPSFILRQERRRTSSLRFLEGQPAVRYSELFRILAAQTPTEPRRDSALALEENVAAVDRVARAFERTVSKTMCTTDVDAVTEAPPSLTVSHLTGRDNGRSEDLQLVDMEEEAH